MATTTEGPGKAGSAAAHPLPARIYATIRPARRAAAGPGVPGRPDERRHALAGPRRRRFHEGSVAPRRPNLAGLPGHVQREARVEPHRAGLGDIRLRRHAHLGVDVEEPFGVAGRVHELV